MHAGLKDRLSVLGLVDLQINSTLHARISKQKRARQCIPTASIAAVQKHEDAIGCEFLHPSFDTELI